MLAVPVERTWQGGARRRFELSLRYMFGEGEVVGWLAEWNLTNPAD